MPPPRIRRFLGRIRFNLLQIMGSCNRCIAAKKEFWQMMGATKLHGCYRLYAGKTYAKIFWLVVMITAGFIFTEVDAQLLYLYRNSNVDTQLQIVYDHADKPMVSVCSYNVVRKSYVEGLMQTHGFSVDLLNYLMHIYSPLEDYSSSTLKNDMNIGQDLLDEYMLRNPDFTIASFVANASQRCEDYMLKCFYEGTEFDCCDPKYTSPIMTDLGQCYQTNLAILQRDFTVAYQFGSVQGLQMLLDYRTDEQLPVANSSGILVKRPFFNTFENGFRIYVHNEMAVSFMSTEVISVSPNNKIAIALRPAKYQFLERSVGGECRSSWPKGYSHRTPYSETLCQALCIARTYVATCGCAPLRFNLLKHEKTCTPKQLFDCVTTKFPISRVSGVRELMPDCKDCMPQCQNFVYYSHNSYAHGILPATVQYMEQLGERFSPEYVSLKNRRNVVGMHVFFEAKRFVLYTQSTLSDLTNVLSNIGGNMGLFHGASVVSLFEMALVTFKVVWSLISNKRTCYMESKQMKEDARKKRLEEILSDVTLDRQTSQPHSQTSEETSTCEQTSTSESHSMTAAMDEVRRGHVEDLSVDGLSIKLAEEPRQRSNRVSFFLSSELGQASMDADIDSDDSTRVELRSDKVVTEFVIERD
ncbi:unnamed protein product [Toxocara canis]|uniref:Acid-sensing ion channel 1 n=1 Tax=Toxocara canis TaxID=6265 RepID=A0A183V310_TOXCA|nr:unnamed protein product [Toxocara canis]